MSAPENNEPGLVDGEQWARLSVNIGTEPAAALRLWMEVLDINATESIRRAISVWNFAETAAIEGKRLALIGEDASVREVYIDAEQQQPEGEQVSIIAAADTDEKVPSPGVQAYIADLESAIARLTGKPFTLKALITEDCPGTLLSNPNRTDDGHIPHVYIKRMVGRRLIPGPCGYCGAPNPDATDD